MMSPEDKKTIAKYYRQEANKLEALVKDKNPPNKDPIMEHVKRLRKEADDFDGTAAEFDQGLKNMAKGAGRKAQGTEVNGIARNQT